MTKTADFNSFDGGEPIADLREELDKVGAYKARSLFFFIDALKVIFAVHWSARENGVFIKMFEEHWAEVGPHGIQTRRRDLLNMANGAACNRDIKNPPAYFTKCAKELLK